MNPVRAPSFHHQSSSRLEIIPDWPRLPAGYTLERVSGVAVDSRGFIYVAHRGENPLLCLHPDGTLFREIGAGLYRKTIGYDLRGPVPVAMETRHWLHGLHVDPWDNLWITDVGRHLVMKFSPYGRELLMTLGVDGQSGCDETHFYQPTHVVVLPTGEFFVADGYGNSRVAKFSADGRYLQAWGTRGTAPGEFHTPHVIVVDRENRLYVSDRENDRIQVFATDSRLLAVWPGLHSVDGLYVGPEGQLYGAAGLDNALLQFSPDGRVLETWAEPGCFTYPHAVAADRAGYLYAAEIAGNRLLKLRLTAPSPGS